MDKATTTDVVIRQPDVTEDRTVSTGLIARAQSVEVDSNNAVAVGDGILIELKQHQKRISDRLNPIIDNAHKAHKGLCDIRKELIDPLVAAAGDIQGKRRTFVDEQERIRLATERRLQEKARKAEEEKRIAEAERLEREHRHEEAEQVISAPVHTPVVVVPTPVPKTAGVSLREHWIFRIKDDTEIPREWLMPNEKAIGARVRVMKLKTNIPGIEPYNDASVAVRTG